MKMRTLCPVLAGVVGLFFAGSTQAATEIFHSIPPIPATSTDWSSDLPFTQFDPSLGTLVSVEILLNGGLTTTITVTNDADTSSSGSATTGVQITAQDAGNNLSAGIFTVMSSPNFSYSLGAGGSTSSGAITGSGSSDETYTAAPVLAEFTGGGTYDLPASTFTQTFLANTGGNTSASQTTTASLAGTVFYNYTPVPEPTSIGLVALALPLLAGRRRRKA
jgi:hypothetical protein